MISAASRTAWSRTAGSGSATARSAAWSRAATEGRRSMAMAAPQRWWKWRMGKTLSSSPAWVKASWISWKNSDGDQVLLDLIQHPVRAGAQPAVGTADERSQRSGSSAKASTARLTAVISVWSARKRTKVACAISDQMILTGGRRTPQP
jgi:hypothetical protein